VTEALPSGVWPNLSVAAYLVREEYPASAKQFLVRRGVIETTACRGASGSFPEDHRRAFDALTESIAAWHDRLGIEG
jgi:hypothetical protein